ncbi:hypothetical protein BOW53_16815 [Solemya pervernicosa gill symbiont]|uniref:Uncharacterized protein n=1 Tax=Solemya pervernicosa gill symbiont TaxID=642797 RepID=A0A1T2KYQ3_9GAMM|nr:hypothetical protein [Solemya pervernicosa gill symbiont]OOZ37987.1 hypothetical protein BOW53_16815 [Solemya pervernicosa gill symbiont]
MNNVIFNGVTQMLGYGLSGVILLFSILIFVLLKNEQNKKKPRAEMLRIIKLFMITNAIASTMLFVSSYIDMSSDDNLGGHWELHRGNKRIYTTQSDIHHVKNLIRGIYIYHINSKEPIYGCYEGFYKNRHMSGTWMERKTPFNIDSACESEGLVASGTLSFIVNDSFDAFSGKYMTDTDINEVQYLFQGTRG